MNKLFRVCKCTNVYRKTIHTSNATHTVLSLLNNNMDSEELLKLDKEELVKKILKLQEQCNILKAKCVTPSKLQVLKQKFDKYEKKNKKKFDYGSHGQRKIALKVSYFGWDYMGLQDNPGLDDSIEKIVFEALLRTNLLISEGDERGYTKCGRTDKGVSAFSQVMCLNLRSLVAKPDGHDDSNTQEELDYCNILNSVLPPEIKVTAWAPTKDLFSARFHCTGRVYKYFFPMGALDIEKMNSAAKLLVGQHDFRNFCKMNVQETTIFMRKIRDFNVQSVELQEHDSPYKMCVATIHGTGFLYHQVRYMMGVLFLIGVGLEESDVISDLLDIEKMPKKPQYGMMADFPLTLYDCSFDDLNWTVTEKASEKLLSHFQKMWTTMAIKSEMAKSMLEKFMEDARIPTNYVGLPRDTEARPPGSSIDIPNYALNGFLLSEKSVKKHKKVIKRTTGLSLEEKIDNLEKRKLRKIDNSTDASASDTT